MKKLITVLVLSLILTSCVNKPVLLTNREITTHFKGDKSFDYYWSKTIDLFAEKGITIKTIDKSSGLIVAEKCSFKNKYTVEDSNGNLEDNTAYVVITRMKSFLYEYAEPEVINGVWNIRIKQTENGCIINVNINQLVAYTEILPTQYTPYRKIRFEIKSTGVFEQYMFNKLNN